MARVMRKVAGTNYNATAQIKCAGYKGAAAGMCDAGVVRNADAGTYIDVTLPDKTTRTIFFNKDGSFLSFSTAEADGTAAMKATASRDGEHNHRDFRKGEIRNSRCICSG